MAVVDVPLCIDTANSQALEAALKLYDGKALINSVNGEEKSLETVLPLEKEFEQSVKKPILNISYEGTVHNRAEIYAKMGISHFRA